MARVRLFARLTPLAAVGRLRMLNTRRAARVNGAVKVELATGLGVTENFSHAGVYFVTPVHVSPGERIPFTMVVAEPFSQDPIRLECHGTVLRVEPRDGQFGVAAKIDSLWIAQTGLAVAPPPPPPEIVI